MLRRDAVGAGAGDHFEVSWTLASPAIERNPRPCHRSCQQQNKQHKHGWMGVADFCLDDFKIVALRHASHGPTSGGTQHGIAATCKTKGHGGCNCRLFWREAGTFTS